MEHYDSYQTTVSLTCDYMQQKRKSRKSVSHSAHSFFKREPCDGTPPSLLGGSSCVVSSSNNSAPDPLLSLFILPGANDFAKVELKLSTETNTNKKSLDEDMFERKAQTPLPYTKDQEERAKRCEFVGELFLSTVLYDGL
ncbi:hypothetical protein SAY86_012064 [Trapa natans]|uniref:Di19 C-terminal domain-containing protein n=1 Tax=Trapa natans TaxID=22666 RepID=A0AAN7LWK8_TRANT|nr:hypothetical protein SAY86_012064 [Trapa natans]